MKCSNCGFVYDDEPECPICGTSVQPEEETPNPYREPEAAAAPPVPPAPAVPPVPPVPPKRPKALMILLVCFVGVISVCTLYHTVFDIVYKISHAEKLREREKAADRVTKLTNNMLDTIESPEFWQSLMNNAFAKNTPDFSFDYNDYLDKFDLPRKGLDEMLSAEEELSDGKTRKLGEAYDFGKGTLTLTKAEVVQESFGFDAAQQLVAFSVTVTNNTKTAQNYESLSLTVGDEAFDREHYKFEESGFDESEVFNAVAPGASVSAVYYYSLPKDTQTFKCKATVSDSGMQYSASADYEAVLTAN